MTARLSKEEFYLAYLRDQCNVPEDKALQMVRHWIALEPDLVGGKDPEKLLDAMERFVREKLNDMPAPKYSPRAHGRRYGKNQTDQIGLFGNDEPVS